MIGTTEEWRRRVATIAGAVLLGLAALAFADLADRAQLVFQSLLAISPFAMLAITPITFAGIAWITRRWFPLTSGSGIPQVITAARKPADAGRSPLVSLPTALVKVVMTCGMLCVGAPVGREGPTVQLAAAINVALHRWLRVPLTSGVLIAGGAAGVAAAFNTPLAGVAFAIEELASAYKQKVAVLVMMTVMIAGFVSLGIAGDYVYLGAMGARLPLTTVLAVIPVAGIIGGAAGGLFTRLMLAVVGPGNRPWHRLRSRPVWLAFGCGVVVAVMGLASHGSSWSTGYAATKTMVEGMAQPWWVCFARFAATIATAWSGTPGGIFAPSLSLGAGIGNLLGGLWPHASLGPIVLLGMIAYFTGVIRAPLTAVIIISEVTASRAMILPLFATAIIADGVAALICRERLYHALSRNFLPERERDEIN